MKLVKCIVRPDSVPGVICALESFGISGVTVLDVRGRGRQTRPTGDFRGKTYERCLPMSMLEIVAADEVVDDVVTVVIDHTRTGKYGDGRVLIIPIDEGYSIRTRQSGAA